MTTLDGSVETWWILPSPELDFNEEVEGYCELAAGQYGSALRAIIILMGPSGEFYIALFWNDVEEGTEAIRSDVRRALEQIELEKEGPESSFMRLMTFDPNGKPGGLRGEEWELPNEVTVFYFHPSDLVFPPGWSDIPKKLLETN